MIPLSELRLGNIFLHGGKLNKVVDYLSFTNTYHYEPIKLTPEMLEQVGAELEFGFYIIGRLTIDFNRDKHGIFKHSAFIKDSLIDDFNYLHELQNIYYFTHNKQELPIDINTLKI